MVSWMFVVHTAVANCARHGVNKEQLVPKHITHQHHLERPVMDGEHQQQQDIGRRLEHAINWVEGQACPGRERLAGVVDVMVVVQPLDEGVMESAVDPVNHELDDEQVQASPSEVRQEPADFLGRKVHPPQPVLGDPLADGGHERVPNEGHLRHTDLIKLCPQ
jgi:hypothetical protein